MIEPASATWRHVEQWANGALSSARARLESMHVHHEEETVALRGSIRTLKALLALAEAPAEQSTEEQSPVEY